MVFAMAVVRMVFATHGARDAILFIIIVLLHIALPHGEGSSLIEHHITAAYRPTRRMILRQPRR
jgi:hypothetical protein